MQTCKCRFKPTGPEIQLLEKLRQNPPLRERLEPIVDMTLNTEGDLDAHQIEALLIVEINKLGNQALQCWAGKVEQHQSELTRSQHPGLQQREQKNFKWWSTFGQVEVRERLWRTPQCSYIHPFPDRLGLRQRGCSKVLHPL